MNPPRIPFNRPTLTGGELGHLERAISAGWLSGDGHFTRGCQRLLEDQLGVGRVFLTTSCTHALEMAALLLAIAPGDEVIVPSFAFVSTANAFALRGARPVFVDVRADTLNLDESRLDELITPRTRAIVVLHYAGVACEMDTVVRIADERGIEIVEDNAHGLFGTYGGRPLGTFGALSTQSFHATKNLTCGEGGALFVNDERLVSRAEIVREKGTDRSGFMRGEVAKYTWVDLGSSYLPSELLAAFLFAQLEVRDAIQEARRRLWENYRDGLADWARRHDVQLPVVPSGCESAYHLFHMLLPSARSRRDLIEHLASSGIEAAFHYVPLHASRMGLKFGAAVADCPVSTEVSERLVRLPFYTGLTGPEQTKVVEAVRSFSP